jgi:hypothetical protein
MHSDRLIGLAYACEQFHSGMNSRGYRLLCRINWRPRTKRAARLEPREDYTIAREWAAHYVRLARRNPRAF